MERGACLEQGHEREGRAGVRLLVLAAGAAGSLRKPCVRACECAAWPPVADALQPERLVRSLLQQKPGVIRTSCEVPGLYADMRT